MNSNPVPRVLLTPREISMIQLAVELMIKQGNFLLSESLMDNGSTKPQVDQIIADTKLMEELKVSLAELDSSVPWEVRAI